MSLEHLKPALLAADFRPHSLTVGAPVTDLSALASSSSLEIFRLAWRHGDRATLAELLTGDPWPASALEGYKALPDDERTEVLALAGFQIHELVHKIDFLTTPFGVSFHGRCCLETLGLQEHASQIVMGLERSGTQGPLRDHPSNHQADTVGEGFDALTARVRWFDAARGAPACFVRPGWGGDESPVNLFGVALRKVVVHDTMLSLELPGQPGAYLRPITLLESRAVSISLFHLFGRLGADDYASSEVARYIRVFYEPLAAYPDYRFLLDLFSRAVGAADFPSLVEDEGAAALKAVLLNVVVLGWYALHAPPLMSLDPATFANSSPVLRLVLALKHLEDALVTKTVRQSTGVQFLDSVDASDAAERMHIVPCREVLSYCIQYAEALRARNRAENTHPSLANHFDYIFSNQIAQLRRRVERGYESMLGMPDDGHLLGGFEDFEVDEHLLLEVYSPPRDVEQWFAVRENLLFRYPRPTNFALQVRSFIDSDPSAPRSVSDQRGADEIAAIVKSGIEAFYKGDHDAAEPPLTRGAERGLPEAAYCLGVILRERADFSQAEQAFAQAARGGVPEAAYNLGVLLRDRNDLVGAKLAFAHADSLGDGDAANDLGVLLLEQKDVARAIPAFCRADARGNAEAPNSIGVFHSAAGAFGFAREAFERADDRGSARGSQNLAIALRASGDHTAADIASRRAERRRRAAFSLTGDLDGTPGAVEAQDHLPTGQATLRAAFAGMVEQLEARFPQFSVESVIEPLCVCVLAGMNLILSTPSSIFENATLLAKAATACVEDATTVTLTPAVAVSRRPTGLVPTDASFVILKDIGRFRPDTLTDVMLLLGESPIGERCLHLHGRFVRLPALLAVFAIQDLDHESEGRLEMLRPSFAMTVLVSE